MPELPEVETIRAALAPVLPGRSVVEASTHPSPKFADAPLALGGELGEVRRRGKYLLIDLWGLDRPGPADEPAGPAGPGAPGAAAGHELIVHLGMTGQVRLRPCDEPVDPYVRAWWRLDDGRRLELRDVRQFGQVAVVRAGDHARLATLAALGPEPLGPDFTAAGLWHALRGRRAAVKTLLLSQRPVAGVGNIYADEALWDARVHPALPGDRLSRPAAGRLHAAIVAALDAGVRHGGTTLRDYRTLDEGEGTNQHHLRCYGRADEPCLRCAAPLRRTTLDGRGTTWCPRCQRRR